MQESLVPTWCRGTIWREGTGWFGVEVRSRRQYDILVIITKTETIKYLYFNFCSLVVQSILNKCK